MAGLSEDGIQIIRNAAVVHNVDPEGRRVAPPISSTWVRRGILLILKSRQYVGEAIGFENAQVCKGEKGRVASAVPDRAETILRKEKLRGG